MSTTTLEKPKQKNLRDLLEEQIRDLYNAESRYAEFLSKIQFSTTDEDLESKFGYVREGTQHNLVSLTSICKELGIPPTGVTCQAMSGLLREADHTNEEYANGSLKDAALIANAQRIAHYEIAGFGTAKAYAKNLGYKDIADKLEKMSEQSGAIDEKLTKLATGSWISSGINDDAV